MKSLIFTIFVLIYSISTGASYPSVNRPFHEKHSASSFLSKAQCSTCHPEGRDHSEPLNRSHCESCHSPKSYSGGKPGYAQEPPDSCTYCHSRTRNIQNTTHESPGHRNLNCMACHNDRHVDALTNRQQCLSCHSGQTNHFSDARNCYSCHFFSMGIDQNNPQRHGAPIETH